MWSVHHQFDGRVMCVQKVKMCFVLGNVGKSFYKTSVIFQHHNETQILDFYDHLRSLPSCCY